MCSHMKVMFIVFSFDYVHGGSAGCFEARRAPTSRTGIGPLVLALLALFGGVRQSSGYISSGLRS